MQPVLDIAGEVNEALHSNRAVVALESTFIAHGLPWPVNLQTAREAETVIRAEGAVPATVAVLHGRPKVGLNEAELEALAGGKTEIAKASRRDLAAMIAQERTAATTVAATMFIAYSAGIRVLATGGIGGVHRGAAETFDVSADLLELARAAVCVVCAGAKSILDIPRTLEFLETHGVPVVGYRTDLFPAFYIRSSSGQLDTRVDSPAEVARLLQIHWQLQAGGMVLAQPCPAEHALEHHELEDALRMADLQAQERRVKGKQLTPFLLARLAELTKGKTLAANRALLVANARLAAQVAKAL